MNFFVPLFTILEVIVCLLLSLLVLMQRPRQEGLGAAFGSGVTDQMFGAQTTNVLQKATVYLGVALFGLTFVLAICISKQNAQKANATFVESSDKVVKPPAPANAPATPGAAGDVAGQKVETEPAKKAEGENATQPPAAPAPATPAPAPADGKPAGQKPAENKPAAPAPPSTGATNQPAAPAPAPAK